MLVIHFSRMTKCATALAGAAVLSGGTVSATAAEASAAAAPQIIVAGAYTASVTESEGIAFVGPADRVLLGRQHSGDENGRTEYWLAGIAG